MPESHHKQGDLHETIECFFFLGAAAVAATGPALAAEGFALRYNLAGTLGGEMFAPPDQSGLAMGVALTYADIRKITGPDGKPIKAGVPGGTVPLPSPAPAAMYPRYNPHAVSVHATGSLRQWNLALGYVTHEKYAGGRFLFGLNLPYATKTQTVRNEGATPALQWPSAVPALTQTAVNAGFDRQYQSALAAQGAADSGKVSGVGDAELQAGWLYQNERMRMLAGASLILPTGKYQAGPGPSIGHGNFYTLRPAVQMAYLFTPQLGLSGKLTLGLNTRNKDNDLRSGNWLSLESALGYKTSVGVLGLHAIHAQQFQDDSGNAWGASRLRSTNAGVFFTTKLSAIDAAITAQAMSTVRSRNAKAGHFFQLRLIKVF